MKKHIVVIGGGLAGTSAAHRLSEYGHDVTIIERGNYLGGRIRTRTVGGEAIELGAGFLTKGCKNLLTFLRDTELEMKLHHQQGKSGIYRNGGVSMLAPGAIFNGKILSWGAMLKVAPLLAKTFALWGLLDMHACYKADAFDGRSVTDSLTDKYSKELLEYIIQPALNGYFYWTPEHTSEAMFFVLCKMLFSHKTYKMRGGLQCIPEKMAENSTVLLGHTVKKVACDQKEYTIFVEHNGENKTIRADGIVCATTASVVPNILPDLTKIQRDFFEKINYSSATLLNSTYEQEQVHENQSIAFARQEGIGLAAITLSQGLSESGAPLSSVKIYASGAIAKKLGESEDKAIIDRLTDESKSVLNNILTGDPKPTTTHVHRWPEALPCFDVGHLKRLRAFADGKIEDQQLPLVFAGDYIGGPFMEGAFTSGLQAATRLHSRFNA